MLGGARGFNKKANMKRHMVVHSRDAGGRSLNNDEDIQPMIAGVSAEGRLLLWFLIVTCSCCPYLYFGSAIMLVTYLSKYGQQE